MLLFLEAQCRRNLLTGIVLIDAVNASAKIVDGMF
jgi:hypothetical protein